MPVVSIDPDPAFKEVTVVDPPSSVPVVFIVPLPESSESTTAVVARNELKIEWADTLSVLLIETAPWVVIPLARETCPLTLRVLPPRET